MIRVVIADDHHLFRQGLRNLLGKEPDINVVGEASDGQDAIDTVSRSRPDVVVMDVEMPGMNGIEATVRIRKSFPTIQVVMLSMHSDPVLIGQTLDNGAKGYVLKSRSAWTWSKRYERLAGEPPIFPRPSIFQRTSMIRCLAALYPD